MKKIIISGPGNSGSGAIIDLLAAHKDIYLPFYNQEFRIVNDPEGLSNLENNLYENFSHNNTAYAFNKFEIFCNNLNKLKSKQKKIYPKNFKDDYSKFLKNIKLVEYNGLPQFQKFNLNYFEKIKFYFNRLILRKKIRDINIFKMNIPIDHEIFLTYSIGFINDVIKNSKEYNPDKIPLLDQSINMFNADNNIKFFDQSKCIITLRDPRAVFYMLKNSAQMAYDGLDIIKFIKWYKFTYQKIKNSKFDKKKFMIIQFEDFLNDYENKRDQIFKFLEIKDDESFFNINLSKKNSEQTMSKLNKNYIDLIEKELRDFLIW